MKTSSVIVFCAAALLAGCGGAQGSLGGSRAMPPGADSREALQQQTIGGGRAACPSARRGEGRCLAMIQSRSGIEPTVAGWAPADFQARYMLPSATKGAGQIVAIVDAYDNPNAASDLSAYRTQFALGTAGFTKYNQTGQTKNYPAGNTGWGIEIDLDVQMVSATCPLCTIYLVEANSAGGHDLQTAEAEAVKLGAHIVSNSWICYGSVSCVNKHYFDGPGVEYLAASGDSGSGQEGAPMAFASVASIGGTVLAKNGSGYTESLWSGSGGGCVTGVKKPKWQHDKFCAHRATNDAAAVASGIAEYDTYGYHGWFTVGGTSASSPLLAGVFGLAGNATAQNGGRTFWQKGHHQYLYDVCDGSCLAGTYSYGGGWGSPNGIGAF